MDCKILLTLTLVATFGCQSAGKLIVKPKDTDVKVNHSTYFNCSTDHGSTAIFWFHGTKYVYTGMAILEPYHERFEIDRNTWNGTYIYNLVIHSVQPGDAGQYSCNEDEGFGEKYSTQLVVLEDDPICRSNKELDEVIGQTTCKIEPDEVELECSVTYHGNIPPQMEWKKVGENSSTPLDVSVDTSRNHFISTLKLRGDIALDNSSYLCETKRTTREPNKCISNVIKVLYATRNSNALRNSANREENGLLKRQHLGLPRSFVPRHPDELSEKYQAHPDFVEEIRTKAAEKKKKPINGLTILDRELFVVSGESSEIEVYDSMKLSFSRRWKLKELINPVDIASCSRSKCLFILVCKTAEQLNNILIVHRNGKLLYNWSTGYGHGLSVTDRSTVILTLYTENKLKEYSAAGELSLEMDLSLIGSIRFPWHGIKLTSDQFVISHGSGDDDLHKVSIVSRGLELIRTLGGKRGSNIGQMNCPVYLSVDRYGFVSVVDRDNGRVLLLESDLEFKRQILSKEEHGLRYPTRIVLDESNGLLLVAENIRDYNGRILIFSSDHWSQDKILYSRF